jgi:NAD(P)H-dependent FMN reductase
LEKDFNEMEDLQYSSIDEYYYEEANEHLKGILDFFDMECGPNEVPTAECQFTFALVMLKTGNVMSAVEFMQKALQIYQNNLGEFDRKTKEVEDTLRKVEGMIKDLNQ